MTIKRFAKPRPRGDDRLSHRHRAVIDTYFTNNFDQSKALLANGYSEKTCAHAQTVVFQHPAVVAEIKRRQEYMARKYEINEAWVLKNLVRMAQANMGQIMLKLQKHGYDLSCLDEDELYAIGEFTEESYVEGRGDHAQRIKRLKVKSADRLAANRDLGRTLGMFKDNVNVSVESSIVERLQKARAKIKEEAK